MYLITHHDLRYEEVNTQPDTFKPRNDMIFDINVLLETVTNDKVTDCIVSNEINDKETITKELVEDKDVSDAKDVEVKENLKEFDQEDIVANEEVCNEESEEVDKEETAELQKDCTELVAIEKKTKGPINVHKLHRQKKQKKEKRSKLKFKRPSKFKAMMDNDNPVFKDIMDKQSLDRDDKNRLILEYFKEFHSNANYEELMFLGSFDDVEVEIINEFISNVWRYVNDADYISDDVFTVMSEAECAFELTENANGSAV
jgi:hypothetical protein